MDALVANPSDIATLVRAMDAVLIDQPAMAERRLRPVEPERFVRIAKLSIGPLAVSAQCNNEIF
jgi:hypothetical protein